MTGAEVKRVLSAEELSAVLAPVGRPVPSPRDRSALAASLARKVVIVWMIRRPLMEDAIDSAPTALRRL
ncbi:hypothetical protein M1D46_01780 [Microbacterium sp. JZ70]